MPGSFSHSRGRGTSEPIVPFLANASLVADVIQSKASSAAIFPQQSLELASQARALVEALNAHTRGAIASWGTPTLEDFEAVRDLKEYVP